MAKIRILRSNLDSNNDEIWKVFGPNRVQIHQDPTFVVNLFIATRLSELCFLSVCRFVVVNVCARILHLTLCERESERPAV